MIDVTVVLLDGVLPSTSLVPLEIFACAGALFEMVTGGTPEPKFKVRTVTLDGRKSRNFVPVEIEPTMALSDVRKTDLVIVPTAGMDLVAARETNKQLVDWIAKRVNHAAIAGICTGVSLLAAAGILDGKPATTHWCVVEQCRALYPNVNWEGDKFVTESDNVFCGGGLYASIDLSLYLVEHFCGHMVAVQTAKALLLESPRIWQSGHAATPPRSAHDDEPVQRAQKYLLSHFKEEVDLDQVANKVGMSPRNFARRFKAATGEAPLAYLHRLRIDTARKYLENAHLSVQEICQKIGYEDVAFFRKLFRRHTGSSPRQYRERFGPRKAA